MSLVRKAILFGVLVVLTTPALTADRVVYEGDKGPGKGKHIVFIASDH